MTLRAAHSRGERRGTSALQRAPCDKTVFGQSGRLEPSLVGASNTRVAHVRHDRQPTRHARLHPSEREVRGARRVGRAAEGDALLRFERLDPRNAVESVAHLGFHVPNLGFKPVEARIDLVKARGVSCNRRLDFGQVVGDYPHGVALVAHRAHFLKASIVAFARQGSVDSLSAANPAPNQGAR